MQSHQAIPPEPIEVEAIHGTGPIEVVPLDGRVHVTLGAETAVLDGQGVDDLAHGLLEASSALSEVKG